MVSMTENALKKRLFTMFGKQTKTQAIDVLGSGRCGTSMVTRALSFIGVDIGSEFIKTNKNNPKGFWENKKVVEIQKQINAKMKWKRPYTKSGWHKSKKIEPFKSELKEMVEQKFADKAYWAFKDPRNCECIELWQDILTDLDMTPSYLVMIRNPIDVAESFKEAYNEKNNKSLRLWQMRTLVVLMATRGEPRIVVDYDDFLDDSLGKLHDIARALNLPWPKDEAKLKQQLDEFVDPGLRHRRTTLDDLDAADDIDEDIKTLYRICLRASRYPEYFQSKQFESQIAGLYQAFLDSGIKV
ncbi:MAG TPA: hypothetical protein VFK33_02745 [Bacillales bacterium]|nr:hypothetical protein [Bacillales bacterium]